MTCESGKSGKLGHWISPKNYGSAAKSKLALPPWNTAENTSQFLISKGSKVICGKAAPLFGQAGGSLSVGAIGATFGIGIVNGKLRFEMGAAALLGFEVYFTMDLEKLFD